MIISVCAFLKSRLVDFRYRLFAGLVVSFLALSAWSDDAGKPRAPSSANNPKLPLKHESEADGGAMLRVVGGLVVVVLIGYVAIYALKRYMPSVVGHSVAGQHKINVLETRRLTPKTTLFLVEVEGTRLLLAQSGDHVSNLHRLEDRETPKADGTGADRG